MQIDVTITTVSPMDKAGYFSFGTANDLGIHSELFVPAMVDLIEKGVVTGRKKTLHPRKNIFTVASGTKRMYEFMHEWR